MFLRLIPSATCAALLLAAPAMAQSSRYDGDWRQAQNPPPAAEPARHRPPRLQRLLRELDRITTEAERERAAHPRLLRDLRTLVRRYSRRWRRVIVSDNFRDGDLTYNPHWVVRSGEFTVGRRGLVMRSGDYGAAVPTYPGPESAPSAEPEREPQIGEAIIGSLLEGLTRDPDDRRGDGRSDSTPWRPPEERVPAAPGRIGRIHTEAAIPNAFVMRVTLRSHDNRGGGFEMGVGQGRRANGYRLIYRPGERRPLRLIRAGQGGRAFIRLVSEPVRLEDGKRHKLELTRDVLGEMTVSLDGRLLLRLRDDSHQHDFDRVLLRNLGGTYTVRGVAVYGAS